MKNMTKMIRFIAVAIATAFIWLLHGSTITYARNPIGKRLTIRQENKILKGKMDSLLLEIERYKTELQRTDSMTNEILDYYEMADSEESIHISPEDYTTEISDSLLNIWYAHKLAHGYDDEQYDMDSVKFESNVPDEVYIDRIRKMNSFITLPYNDIVKNYIIMYSEKMKKSMPHVLGLCEYYMPIFEEIFNRYDLPEELKAMAVIESAMNPLAVSKAGAKGMWQFMYQTAKIYGLHIDSFVDERLDPVKAADAAARYLHDSYEIFGDWNLAIASYNCGAGNVNKAIRRSGGKRSFWDIWPYLPKETRGYGPAFVGALYTMTYYKEHGIRPEAIALPMHVDTFKINKMLHLKQVSEITGAPLEELKNLNPQYRHEIIPGNEREYILRLPYRYTNAFIEHEDSIYRHKADIYFNPVTIKKIKDGGDGERIVYKVKGGDYLGKIASRYGVSVAQIKRWNNLKSNNIRIGQRLIIYRGGKAPAVSTSTKSDTKPSASSSASENSSVQSTNSGNKITYTVKKGDVLGKIAEAHHVGLSQLKKWNNITGSNIMIGQKLVIYTNDAPTDKDTQNSEKGYTIYTVKSGDSLYSIAKKYPGVSHENIMEYNGLKSSKLMPGMKLKIPVH